MKIEKFISTGSQMCNLGKHEWSVPRLFELSKNLPVMDIPLNHLNVYHCYEKLTLRDMVSHFQAISRADMKYPIILDEDGEIMDGRHRIMRALMHGDVSIKAVRFDKNPPPCSVLDED